MAPINRKSRLPACDSIPEQIRLIIKYYQRTEGQPPASTMKLPTATINLPTANSTINQNSPINYNPSIKKSVEFARKTCKKQTEDHEKSKLNSFSLRDFYVERPLEVRYMKLDEKIRANAFMTEIIEKSDRQNISLKSLTKRKNEILKLLNDKDYYETVYF